MVIVELLVKKWRLLVMGNFRFLHFYIAIICLLSIVLIPRAFAIEAQYVKVLIDGTNFPSCCGRDGLIKINELYILDINANNLALYKPVSTATLGFHPSDWAVDGIPSTSYATSDGTGSMPAGTQWLLVDLLSIHSITAIRLSTTVTGTSGFAVLTDYRILTSVDNLNWTLAAVVTNQPNVNRSDMVILEDLSVMDVDINYVVALFLAIIILGFFRQIFF